MDVSIGTYRDFINSFYVSIKNNDNVSRKTKKMLNALQKKITKMDSETFKLLSEIHFQYILDVATDGPSNNPFIASIHEGLFNDDSEEKEFSQVNTYENIINVEILNNDSGTITNNSNFNFPKELKNIKWAMKNPMELTIASDNSIWMNDSLWEYMIDILYHEAFAGMPTLYTKPDPPESITLNIGYNQNNLMICLDKGISSCMKIKFNKKINTNGKIYAIVNDEESFKFGLETSFSVRGKYIFRPTTLFGLLVGQKMESKNVEFF